MKTWMTIAALGLAVSGAVSGAAGQDYEIPWSTIDSGGGTLEAGPYRLSGTIGQPDAGAPLEAGPYRLTGGFWAGVGPAGCNIADLAVPFGQLDFFDVSVYLGAFASGEDSADLTSDGILDFFDVQVFLQAFSAGCP